MMTRGSSNKGFFRLFGVCFCAACLAGPVTVFAAEFSADMILSGQGGTREGRLYVKGTRYRMEQEEKGQKVVVLVDRDTNITRVLMPSRKIYMEMESTSPKSAMNDPFQGLKKTEALAEKREAGSETVHGYHCDKYELLYKDQGRVMTLWVADALGWPVRIVQEQGHSMELTNIREEPLDDFLFQMPRGYTNIQAPGGEPATVSSAPEDMAKKEGQDETAAPPAKAPGKGPAPAAESGTAGTIQFNLAGEGGTHDLTSVEKTVDPDKGLVITITGASRFGQDAKGRLSLYRRKTREKVDEVPFLIKEGATSTWRFAAGEEVGAVAFGVYGRSGIEVSVAQAGGGEATAPVKTAQTPPESTGAAQASGKGAGAFSGLLKGAEKSYQDGKKLEAVEQLKRAVRDVWSEIPLTVKDVRLVEDTLEYRPRDTNVYASGEKIHITAQLFGYAWKRIGENYSINLVTDMYFMQGDKILAGREGFGKFEVISPVPNTEFRLDLTYWFTDAPPGAYDVRTVVHDQNSGKSTRFMTRIELK